MLKALKQTITRKDSIPDLEEPKVPKGILMNSTRRRILQYLSRYPCIHQNEIAKTMGLSLNNARWHLGKLVENGYLSTSRIGKKRVFYPTGLIELDDIGILTLVNNKKTIRIFPIISSTPGITQKEISNLTNIKPQSLTEKLKLFEKYGLIASVHDGSYKRYYPTELIKAREKTNHKRFKEFRQIMLKVLVRDGVNPNIIRTTDRNIHIQITAGKAKSDLILYLNPFIRFLELYIPK
ncbi:MAG: winged helix-turn-helix transcriptional regulator [Thermoplasmata archaeon]|nr:winged helix-turn-helix transcriptional regulator [Thermoplasmata archaeon]